jgi:hypothetical protein
LNVRLLFDDMIHRSSLGDGTGNAWEDDNNGDVDQQWLKKKHR